MRPNSFLVLAILVPLALAACGTDKPTRLYVLNATVEKPAETSPDGVAIGIGPITLPKYLDRPEIVTRVNGNSLSQANFDQWGGDLNDNITRVLAADLSNLLATDRVSLYPWKDGAPVEYQITLDINRFEQDADGSTVLNVFWSIVDPSSGKVLTMRRSNYRQAAAAPAAGGASDSDTARPLDPVAAAMSRDLESLSRDIAAGITGLKGS
jgi:uncharacterized protein